MHTKAFGDDMTTYSQMIQEKMPFVLYFKSFCNSETDSKLNIKRKNCTDTYQTLKIKIMCVCVWHMCARTPPQTHTPQLGRVPTFS